ncbi:UDP-N-acetylglucosamine--dolichyl-phosphate N-acetylglucosaminephosphotransferase [Brachionus plicatilis]|uniref:UDP-N-acetylglucosamine--dolichyl-phosphate N-acetylglucosaminephosphotransferase n=1 Tax=Brachionus plicatilis TaxID=10195 RepID=A0A3M7QW68_BRAPC|nr:UDP-N-acetylglucosamine--dolichyl-phosphate N-acetylglucosaminephosphotransferase [Brachionus plicatilis]
MSLASYLADEKLSQTIRLFLNVAISFAGSIILFKIMPKFKDMFIRADLKGTDLSKKNKIQIPEAYGVISGAFFLIVTFLFIPLRFYETLAFNKELSHHQFIEYLAALLSIGCMIFLGFADDVLDLKWRDKLLLPTVASLPLLMVYFANINSTTIIVPYPLRPWLGYAMNLGFLYYVYMGMLAVFCTNAINIYAGINGIEVGQSLVIAFSVLISNLIEFNGPFRDNHIFSMYLIIPFIACAIPLFLYNKYPSRVFVGDTFCYFAGMTFAVVGILGHFSKFLLLFFIPQIFNFLLSIPQLFKFIPCPRHRMPKYNPETDLLEPSVVQFYDKDLSKISQLIFKVFRLFRFIRVTEKLDDKDKKLVQYESSNFTIINFYLTVFGPKREDQLTKQLLTLQIICCLIAFMIRYQLSKLFY